MIRFVLDALSLIIRRGYSLLRGVFRWASWLVIVALLAINLTLIAVPGGYNALSGLAWGVVSLVAEGYAARNATQAGTRQQASADARRLSDLEGERTRLRAERARLDARLTSVEAELDATRKREVTARRTAASLQADNARLEQAAARQARVQRETGQTIRRMQQRSIKMMTRNTAMAFSDAIPVIGAVTVAGGVAWDIWDTCKQLDDLRSLGAALQTDIGTTDETERRWCGLTEGQLFGLIYKDSDPGQRNCVAARLRTDRLDPPECADFPRNAWEFADPQDEVRQDAPTLPPMNYD